MIDPHLTRWPIVAHRSGFELRDRKGARISYHRTKSGALRKRLRLQLAEIEDQEMRMAA